MYVYVIKMNGGGNYTKIGFSVDYLKRLDSLKSGNPYELSILAIIKTHLYKKVEKALHNHFESKNIRGEWFNLNSLDIKYIKCQYKELLEDFNQISYRSPKNQRRLYCGKYTQTTFVNCIRILEDTPVNKRRVLIQDKYSKNPYMRHFLDILDLCKSHKKAISVLKWTNGSRSKIHLSKLRLSIIHRNYKYEPDFTNQIRGLKSCFKLNGIYHKDRIKGKVLRYIQDKTNIDATPYDNAKRLDVFFRLLRVFFNMRRYGGNKQKYKLLKLEDCFLL